MITDLSQLDPNGTYSYADYLTWKFTEFVELVKGHLVKMAAPKTAHQRIVTFLTVEIGSALRKQPCQVFVSPFDVRLLKNPAGKTDREIYTVVQPDLCIICDSAKIDERGCIGAPDWIIEITSQSTFNHDRFTKKELYEAAGVGEYWIVHPHESIVEVYLADADGTYGTPRIYGKEEDNVLSPTLFPELVLELQAVFG